MADVVQYRMERMADELDDLEQRGLFSRREITEIVRRRRDFEYRLKRPSPMKQDFLAYIEYEKQVDSLRNLRKRAIIGELAEMERAQEEAEEGVDENKKRKKKKSRKWKKSISDFAGVLRILDIYRLATVRYKADLDLWFKYLEFCREKKHGRMKQVLARAIRYHPKVPGLWIYAAAWEFDQNLNVSAARALMQSGLRICPNSEDLWVEYLRMELTYLNKLKARKVALGEDVKLLQQNNSHADQRKEENSVATKDMFLPLDADQGSLQEGSLEKREQLFLQQGASVLQTIYHGAINAIPSSLSIRQQFLDILDAADLGHNDELKVEVMEDLKKDFSHDENYWDWIARLQFGNISEQTDSQRSKLMAKLDKVVQVYEEALNALPTAKMFSLYAKFWLDIMFPCGENTVYALSEPVLDVQPFVSSIVNVFEKAKSSGCLTADLACQYISFYLLIGRLNEAKDLAKKLCNELSAAANLWILRCSIEIKWCAKKSPSLSKEDMHSVFELLKDVLTRLSISETGDLWLMALEVFFDNKEYFKKMVNVLMLALGKAGRSDTETSAGSCVLNWVFQREGIQKTREMYKRFLSLPHPSLKLFRHCIELESNAGIAGDDIGIANARKLYESALGIYPEDRELWRDYYVMEMKIGTPESANAVCWRARKVLNDTTMIVNADF